LTAAGTSFYLTGPMSASGARGKSRPRRVRCDSCAPVRARRDCFDDAIERESVQC
jgi:hypothetical protein